MLSAAAMGCSAPPRVQSACRGCLPSRPAGGVSSLSRASFLTAPSQRLQSNAAPMNLRTPRSTLKVSAARGEVLVDVDKPLGLKLAESKQPGGGLVVKSSSGNAARAGIKSGDTVIYTSSFFGDELWPSDNIGFTRSALARCPSPVTIIYVRGDASGINVKRLGKRKAPPRFGRKLTAVQLERASHICVDCGYIYCDQKPWAELDPEWRCPQCQAPKKRFAVYDKGTGRAKGGVAGDVATIATVVGGLVGIGLLGYIGLQF